METKETENKESKLETVIRLLKEIDEEEKQEKINLKENILDKLSNKECNYFMIIKEDEMVTKFKVYGMKCEDYDEAYSMCEHIIGDDDDEEYWLLHKDEVADLIFNLNNNVITQSKIKFESDECDANNTSPQPNSQEGMY